MTSAEKGEVLAHEVLWLTLDSLSSLCLRGGLLTEGRSKANKRDSGAGVLHLPKAAVTLVQFLMLC